MFPHQSISEDEALHANLGRAAARSCSHTVHFYEDDGLFIESLSGFIGGALEAEGACVVLATSAHCRALTNRLRSFGIDVPFIVSSARLIALDAETTLAQFMVGGWPDEKLFFETLEPAFLQARTALSRPDSTVVAFGEMVNLLCHEGRFEAAVRLEQLWNELARRQSVSLRCAYLINMFADAENREAYRQICEEHGAVIPAESYTALNSADRLRMVSSLQQQASTLQSALELRQREMERRRRVEEQLRETEEFARVIVESSVDCVKVLDLEGRIRFVNKPGFKALEITDPNAILGHRWADLWPEEDRVRAQAAVAAALAGSVGSFQGEWRPASGTTKTWDVKITPARGASGEVERLIAVSRDITDLRRAQLAAIHAEKLATAGRMAATIAHEINNPLEAVTNFIYLAQTHEGLPEPVRRQLELADRELTRVAHIARQTLGFYRSTSTSRVMLVSDLIRDALMIYERRLRNKELKVEISVDPELQVFGKDGELRQALLNLTANAIDACQIGGKIWFRAQKTKDWTNGMEDGVRFTLADNGSGMSKDVQRRLFAPFFTTKSDVGTGIGLWVTKCLIEQRGGYMRFRSRQGERCGTVMSFYLPSARPALAAEASDA